MEFKNDPIGYAIHDFLQEQLEGNIIVHSDLCEDDIMPVEYLFRDIEQMPEIEHVALKRCEGKVLDIGAGTGCHSEYLQSTGLEVLAIEKSAGAVEYLKSKEIQTIQSDFMQYNEQKFDTILLLMNGIGLAGSLKNLPTVLHHLKNLLNEDGKILCDSTDINYMYKNEDGSVWVDLNAPYYGEMNFNMVYKNVESGWFPWLYIDPLKLTEYATEAGFDIEIIYEGENNHYLAELKIDRLV